ncbi:MAG: hypothetical protein GY822_23125 [Deltaproteobacteria bacterium]|nr:hypothetical protein [Deltaproteobacteria bacterium]
MDLDIDLDLDDDFGADEDSTRVTAFCADVTPPQDAAVKVLPKLVVFEPGGSAIQSALQSLGVRSRTVELGSDLMGAADEGEVGLVLMSPGMDEELRELFCRAFASRFSHIPVIFIINKTREREAVAEMLRQGAHAVLPWPLPAASDLLPFLDAHTPSGTNIRQAPVPPRASPAQSTELDLLRRKVAVFEQSSQRSISSVDFEKAVSEAATKSAENTSLRSEMTILRERASLLEERIGRMQRDIEVVCTERDSLLSGKKLRGPSIDDEAVVLLRGVESFVWPVEQAIQFFEDLAHEAGPQRAPSLNLHLRTIKLVKSLLERVRDRFNDK